MGKRMAVCVGLNYPGTSAELQGCVNDASDWRGFLESIGYEVRVVLEPTKRQLVAELESLVSVAGFGDRLVVTYSGHGTWVPDRDGDEADKRDEALVCSDYRAGGVLVDDELHAIMGAARFGVRRLLISDSCHSGSVARFHGFRHREKAQGTPRFLPPGRFLEGSDLDRAERVENTTARSAPRKGTVLISGCEDHEYSYDAAFGSPARPNGAMTHAALNAWRPGMTIGAWYAAIRKALPTEDYPQSPVLTALPHQRRWTL